MRVAVSPLPRPFLYRETYISTETALPRWCVLDAFDQVRDPDIRSCEQCMNLPAAQKQIIY
jgi:hypothetical protein